MKIRHFRKSRMAKGDFDIGFNIMGTDFLDRTIWITICLLKIKIIIEIGE